MAKQVKLPTAAEFDNWLKPAEALARLPADWTVRTKRDEIMSRVIDGSLIAMARSGSVRDGSGVRPFGITPIDPTLWSEPWVARDDSFWRTGGLTFDDTPPLDVMFSIEPKRDTPTAIVSFRDMRIEPTSFAREFAAHISPDEPAPKAPTGNAEPLSAEEFASWLTPKAALAAVPSDIDEAERRAWLIRRLREGLIVARAESKVIIDINGREEAQRVTIERRFWNWRDQGDWFSSGDLEVTDAPEEISAGPRLALTAYSYEPEKSRITRFTSATFLGVRLDPAAFPRPKQRTNNGAPTPDEFESWLHPSDVVNHYYQEEHDDRKAETRTVSMLCDGFLQAAARQLVINGNDLGLALIPRQMWEALKRTDVWSTGHFRLAVKGESISGYDVRIDPQIRTLPRAKVAKQTEAAKPPETKSLSDGRLAAWAKLFFAAQPDATEKEARASLTGMFPDNSVSRARLRAVMPARRRGRRLKTKEEN